MVSGLRSEILSGFICGAAMLLIILVNRSNSANISRTIMQQISNKNSEMLNDAEMLFTRSFTEHDISEGECNKTLEWFPKPNISNLKVIKRLLKEIHRNLNLFHKAFTVLKNNHTDEYTHSKMIAQALITIEAQQENIQTYLQKQTGLNETGLAIPTRDFYQRKLDCCKLSCIYVEFLRDVGKGLRKKERRKKRKISLVY